MDSSPAVSESHQSQTVCGSAEAITTSVERTKGFEKPLHEAVKMTCGMQWKKPKILESAET